MSRGAVTKGGGNHVGNDDTAPAAPEEDLLDMAGLFNTAIDLGEGEDAHAEASTFGPMILTSCPYDTYTMAL